MFINCRDNCFYCSKTYLIVIASQKSFEMPSVAFNVSFATNGHLRLYNHVTH